MFSCRSKSSKYKLGCFRLADPSIQEEVLAHAAQTLDMDLDTTLKLARKPEAHPIVGVSVSLCTDGYTDNAGLGLIGGVLVTISAS